MPTVKRERREPTEGWPRLAALVAWLEQRAYEELRPVVLFGRPVEERARETATAERTLYRRVARFDAVGMASLFPPPKVAKHRRLPEEVRRAIVALKTEHPAFRPNEIADICAVRFGRRPSPHTVKRLLAEESPLPRAARRFPPYRDIADPAEARLAIIRLHSEGWAVKSIAAYLECSRQQVYRTLQRWVAEGVVGLDDKTSAPRHPATTVTLRTIATVKALQENPGLGGFRIAAALRQQGIILSPRTCRRLLAKHRALYGVLHEPRPARAQAAALHPDPAARVLVPGYPLPRPSPRGREGLVLRGAGRLLARDPRQHAVAQPGSRPRAPRPLRGDPPMGDLGGAGDG